MLLVENKKKILESKIQMKRLIIIIERRAYPIYFIVFYFWDWSIYNLISKPKCKQYNKINLIYVKLLKIYKVNFKTKLFNHQLM